MDSIKHFFTQLFNQLNTEDSWTVVGMLLGAFLIGLITNYFLNKRRVISLEEALEKKVLENTNLTKQLDTLKEQHALQGADLQKVNLELTEKRTNLEKIEAEKKALNSRLNATLVDLDQSAEELQEASNRMEDLNDQILGLRTKNANLNAEIDRRITANAQIVPGEISTETSERYEKEISNLAAENDLLKTSIEELKAGNTAEGTAEATLRITELEAENESLKNKIAFVDTNISNKETEGEESNKEELEDSQAEIAQLESGNEILNATINNLITENEELKERLEALPQYEAGNEALNNSIRELIEENEDLQESRASLTQYEAGNEVLNSTITELIEKNEALERELEASKENQIEWAVSETPTASNEVVEEELDVESAQARIRGLIGSRLTASSEEERDDLKQINGIGPFIEEKLNDLGIYTFEQISQLDDDLVETLTTAIEFFLDRIERDDWVGQADRLFYTKGSTPQEMGSSSKTITQRYATATEKIEVEPLEAAIPEELNQIELEPVIGSEVTPDDLKKIEGIGPKIAQILNEADIMTFAQLAATSTDRLEELLAAAGSRFKMHKPDSWPEQAKLAAIGDWEKLKELQDYLVGGRDVAKG
jgi:predicted flap endonuclease-1-like 5' DNA nuclease